MIHDQPRKDDLLTLTMQPRVGVTTVPTASEDDFAGRLACNGSPIVVRERITLRGLHSSGGIGEVWRAYDEVLEREIALKRLKLDKATCETNRARFFREAKITGRLDHPGIVPIYDYCCAEDGTQCFYTMRFLRGQTLREVIAKFHAERIGAARPLVQGDFLQLLGYFASACNTMAYAHSHRVIHRDLKGENIIVGDFGDVVVLDWGLAKELGDESSPDEDERFAAVMAGGTSGSETLQGELLGTPAYMAPEQALGLINHLDTRTDVYGLAAILYEILTGQPPFRGDSLAAVMDAVISQKPVPPSELVADVPPELERFCLRGLAKAMEDRQESATELAAQVQGWLHTLAERKRTELERERFFDLSMDLLVILDRHGHFSQSNAAWEQTLGWSASERRAASFLAMVVPEDRELAERALGRIWAGASQTMVELRMAATNGPSRWFHWNVKSIPEEAAIYLVGRDITERKQTERELQGLLESVPDAMCVIDPAGAIVRVNAQLEKLFGLSRDQLLGGPVELLIPERLRARHKMHVSHYAAAPTVRSMGARGLTLHGQRADGSEFPLDISLGPVPTDHGVMICCTIRPVNRAAVE